MFLRQYLLSLPETQSVTFVGLVAYLFQFVYIFLVAWTKRFELKANGCTFNLEEK